METAKFFLWFCVLALISWQSLAQNFYDKENTTTLPFPNFWKDLESGDISQEVDNCTRLPFNPKRTLVSNEDQISFSSLLNGGFDNVISTEAYDDVVLVMGNTGVGKTTLVQMIAGDLNRIFGVYTNTNELVIMDDAERIGVPSVVSRTIIPELIVKAEKNLTVVYYDCPGFDDTRGPVQDFATNFFLKQIVSKVKRVKILFLVLHSSVELGHDRLDFDIMAKYATRFVKNMANFKDSIGLVVTKVKNYSHSGMYIKERSIMKRILEFLFAYSQTLHDLLESQTYLDSESRLEILKKIEFVNILLTKNDRGQYNKVSFSRNPEKCGPLSDSTEVAKTRLRIVKLYEGLEYGKVGNITRNFGLALKAETILKISSDYSTEVNQGVANRLLDMVEHFKNWFEQEQLVRVGNYSTSLAFELRDLVKQTSFVFDYIIHKLPGKFDNNSVTAVKFGQILEHQLNKIGYTLPASFTQFTETQDKLLVFFDSIVGAKNVIRRIHDWIITFSDLQDKILDLKVWYEFLAVVQGKLISYEFNKNKSSLNFSRSTLSWLDSIETNNITMVDEDIKLLEKEFGPESTQAQHLNNMMKYAMIDTSITCSNKTLTLKGHFVLFSEFVENSGNIRIPPICDFNQTDMNVAIKIYSANTIFVDASINASGKELNLLLISPKWTVVHENIHINLDGSNGESIDPPKASNGMETYLKAGMPGQHGLAGKPGGPAGIFIGIVDKMDGHILKITANGGEGGPGQHGGKGGNGSQGRKNAVVESQTFADIVVKGTAGFPGGQGGNGGVGGLGGQAGKIKMFSNTDLVSLKLLIKNGNMGEFGIGGVGGSGGQFGSGFSCVLILAPGCDEIAGDTSRAADGPNGSNNSSKKGLVTPKVPCQILNETDSILEFNKFFPDALDFELHTFVENAYQN